MMCKNYAKGYIIVLLVLIVYKFVACQMNIVNEIKKNEQAINVHQD